MATYEYDFGSNAALLKFTVVYDTDTNQFTVKVLTGSLNVNALYWSNGDSDTNDGGIFTGFTGAKSESSLNMNGSNVVWNDDGTSTTLKETWDGGIKTSNAGLTSTPPVSYIVAGSTHDSFVIDGGSFDPEAFSTLGVRATSTTSAGGSIKWADDAPDVSATVTLADVTVDEGTGTATISASLDTAVTGTPLVITLSNGATITIAVGDTTGTSTAFAVQGDDPYVDDESYSVSITGTTGGDFEALNTSDTALVTINDTIQDTTVNLSAATVVEGATANYTFTATLSNASVGDTTITTDQGVITITNGQTTGTLVIASGNVEDVYDDDSSLTATITGATGGDFENLVIGATPTATAYVNDTIQDTTVNLDDAVVNQGAGTATITAHVANAVTVSPLVITLSNGATVTIAVGASSGISTTFAAPDDAIVGITGTPTGGDFEALDTTDTSVVSVDDPAENDVWVVSQGRTMTAPIEWILHNDPPNGDPNTTPTITNLVKLSGGGLWTFTENSITVNSTPSNTTQLQYTLSDGRQGLIDIYAATTTGSTDTIVLSGVNGGLYDFSFVNGEGGIDTITGTTIAGSTGNDYLSGNEANDTLTGNAGDDVLSGGKQGSGGTNGSDNDTLNGGAGVDLISFGEGAAGITFTLTQSASVTVFASTAASELGTDSYVNMEGVIGTNFADTLNGSTLGDILKGGAGNDTINGNAGADTIQGDAGKDTMTGGSEADLFKFNTTGDSLVGAANRDVIGDFAVGTDKIDLSALDANTALAGNQTFSFVAAQTGLTVANSITWQQIGGNTIIHGDVNGNTTADFEIELTGSKALTVLDFVL